MIGSKNKMYELELDNKKNVLALGFFDSIHIGHRSLLQKARDFANQHNANLIVVTFNDNFFKNLNRPIKEVYLLNERLGILNALGYNQILVLDPTIEFLQQTEVEFMQYLLSLNPFAIVAGSDYTFGKNGQGSIKSLSKFMSKHKIRVKEIDLIKMQGTKVASTDIKMFLESGNIPKANELLQDKYFISGTVVKGRQKGGKLGMPTANINIHPFKQIPKDGVYKTITVVDNKEYLSVTNIGIHPTFDCNHFNIETLVLNFSQDLYNKEIKVYFIERIRDIIKFESAEKLVQQVKNDILKSFGREML